VNQYLQAVYAKEINWSVTKFGFMSVGIQMLIRITGIGLHEISH